MGRTTHEIAVAMAVLDCLLTSVDVPGQDPL